jgi:hypothetical protein
MATHPFLALLALFTLVAIALIVFWQQRSARHEQRRRGERPGEHKIQAKNPATNMHGLPQDPLDMPIHATTAVGGTGDETTPAAVPAEPVQAGH